MPEKVDCVVLLFSLTEFVNNYNMLDRILNVCYQNLNEDNGFVIISDFTYVDIPCNNFELGMYTQTFKPGISPRDFEAFNFIIESAPDFLYKHFNIPPFLIFRAGKDAGFN